MRIVFEFEQGEAPITPALLANYWHEGTDSGSSDQQTRDLGLESELAMFAAVKAQPELLRQLWLEKAISWLQWLENSEVYDLVKPVAPPGPDLHKIAAGLHDYARTYFLEDGVLDDFRSDTLIRWVLSLRMVKVSVEDAEGVLLNSDDKPLRRTRSRK
ncbi:hypothetical protein GKZ68_20840 (plasmid) [Hymenobacter sp. BRD128]|uniref:hypothetical protein n=1 Tax=Hymenobacter sp. BRD128 TaxID=2675878 RepID=UPI0015650F8B|nr:hypothetical protein [Hymenobacter sp. BRD128]QKG59131.1 hypothetical protein GKZ68_20840 [Hymenobacter sp. BRD128]